MERNENGLGVPSRTGQGTCSDGGNYVGRGSAYENGTCGMANRQLAMVYSPMQCWRMLYTPEAALRSGTLFEELYKPYEEEW